MVYVDDFIFLLPHHVSKALALLILMMMSILGVPISWNKLQLGPAGSWLGLNLRLSYRLLLQVPELKLRPTTPTTPKLLTPRDAAYLRNSNSQSKIAVAENTQATEAGDVSPRGGGRKGQSIQDAISLDELVSNAETAAPPISQRSLSMNDTNVTNIAENGRREDDLHVSVVRTQSVNDGEPVKM
jgi:hypothetical protein